MSKKSNKSESLPRSRKATVNSRTSQKSVTYAKFPDRFYQRGVQSLDETECSEGQTSSLKRNLYLSHEKAEVRRRWLSLRKKRAETTDPEKISISSEDDKIEGGSNYCEDIAGRKPSQYFDSFQAIWSSVEISTGMREMAPTHWEELEALMEAGEMENIMKFCSDEELSSAALLYASWHGDLSLVRHFVSAGVKVSVTDYEGRSPLHLAACSGSKDCVSFLIDKGASVSIWDKKQQATPLHCAANVGDLDCVKALIAAGAEVNAGLQTTLGRTPLYYAVQANAIECVKLLLGAGAISNTTNVFTETPLHVAAALCYPACIKILLDCGADVRVQYGPSKATPLHLAAEDGNVECTRLLLDAGADLNATNQRLQTPLHLAALGQSAETVELLLSRGAKPNAQDADGRTPLHSAIVKGSRSFECVHVLLGSGARVNHQDKFGYSPLHIAALNEFSYCVRLLIDHGADVTARTKGGASALSFIVRRTPDVLSSFFEKMDNAITLHEHDINDADCELKLNFKLLVPNVQQGESVLFMNLIQTGQRHFLKHPLCEAFLYLKWQLIRKFFLFSLFFHAIFVFLYTTYVIGIYVRSNIFQCGNCTSEFTELNQTSCNDFNTKCTIIPPVMIIDGIFLLIFNLMLLAKEIFQLVHSYKKYLQEWENWVQWFIIVSVFLCGANSMSVAYWQHHVAAIGIFLTWLELMMMVGRFPIFGLYVQMFTTVAANFGKFLLAYFWLLVAFGLSFCVLFPNHPAFKEYAVIGMLKTVVMMSGELEYEDIFHNEDVPILYPWTSHVIFLAFTLLVTIILMNLLVGLAVSDIQGLQKSAGLDRLVRQAELISHIEGMVFSKLLYCLPNKLLKCFHQNALLAPSAYHWAFYIRPNDPRETRIPSDTLENAYKLVASRYNRRKTHLPKYSSGYSQISSEVGSYEPCDQLDQIRTQLSVLSSDTAMQDASITALRDDLEEATKKLDIIQASLQTIHKDIKEVLNPKRIRTISAPTTCLPDANQVTFSQTTDI